MDQPGKNFDEMADARRASLAREMIDFLSHNKKWWLLPIILCLAVMSLLVLVTGSGIAPFIYTLF